MSDPLKPSASLLVKLGSIIVHMEEIASPHRHEFDFAALQTLTKDPEVSEWMQQMDKLAFLPVKRQPQATLGGRVKRTGIAYLHKGEKVVPVKKSVKRSPAKRSGK